MISSVLRKELRVYFFSKPSTWFFLRMITQCIKVGVHTIWCHFGQFKFVQKKNIFKEIPTKAIYQYEEGLFGNTPKLLLNRNIISIL